jgi:proteasome lid subunit RPN8/RPN11
MSGETQGLVADALIMPGTDRERVMRHLHDALPNEGVGLLAVEWTESGGSRFAEIRHFYPGTNFLASPSRFELDRYELIAALRDIDDRGWSLGAIVHSHPLGPAVPSRTDLAEANYPESLMVIASFASHPPDLRAWRLERDGSSWTPHNVPIVATCETERTEENCR